MEKSSKRATNEKLRIVELELSQLEHEELEINAQVKIKIHLPEQNQQFPDKVEEIVEAAGQELKRAFYQKIIEHADLAIVMSRRTGHDGQGIQRIGKRPYTFKTVFGTVRVKRIRIRHKADQRSETPSSKKWRTPRQIYITDGLKAAVCDTAAKESHANTVKQIETRSGEKQLLSKSSILNIVHREGARLRKAQARRAKAVFAANKESKKLLGAAEIYLA